MPKPPRLIWLLYSLFIVYGGTIPFHFAGDHSVIRERLHAVALNPFISPDTGRRLSIPDVVQNVLVFLPFGALGFATLRRPRSVLPRIAAVTALGLALALAIEMLQLLTVDRVASVGDVTMNTIGSALGALLAWQLAAAVRAWAQRLRAEGVADNQVVRPLLVACAALIVAFWQPFDATLDVGTVSAKIRSLQSDLLQFTGLRDEGTSIMLSVFFATTLASYLSVVGERNAAAKAAVIGLGVTFALEASQLLISSRMPSLWDASVAACGIGLGTVIWMASARIAWPRLWLGVIVATTAAAAALQMLSPFEWTPAFHSMGWFPFLGYYAHTTFETLSHVIELVLLYLPLGFFVGGGQPAGWRAIFVAAALALAVAGPIEYLQGYVAGRYPDVTDIGISLCGAAFGAWAGSLGAHSASRLDA